MWEAQQDSLLPTSSFIARGRTRVCIAPAVQWWSREGETPSPEERHKHSPATQSGILITPFSTTFTLERCPRSHLLTHATPLSAIGDNNHLKFPSVFAKPKHSPSCPIALHGKGSWQQSKNAVPVRAGSSHLSHHALLVVTPWATAMLPWPGSPAVTLSPAELPGCYKLKPMCYGAH